MRLPLIFFCVLITIPAFNQTKGKKIDIVSPDKLLRVVFSIENGHAKYEVLRNKLRVLAKSDLGIQLAGEDFSGSLALSASKSAKVSDAFEMFHGKRRLIRYEANETTLTLVNAKGSKIEVQFRVSNDGVAFRYNLQSTLHSVYKVLGETSSFAFPEGWSAFLQPMSDPKTGWSKVNPCYEEHYKGEIKLPAPPPTKSGWVFPALFHSGDTWVLLTEAGLRANYCGARLGYQKETNQYKIQFPDSLEAIPGREFLPTSKEPFSSPWRVIVVGNLNTIIESDLGVALADPAVSMETGFIKPGHSAWSWALLKDDSTVYDVQKKFVDYALNMGWEYCLVDADWDGKIGYERIAQLASYAASKGVGLILWYNSAGNWNDTPYTPKGKLLTHAQREMEFTMLERMGIKGVKIDFFGGDGSSMIQYYIDILNDAAKHHLMVNFHGATLPRGWHRTYPNMMSAEAIKGFEYVTFEQVNADEQPRHCTIIPFTRNAFDPMDFTPLSLDSVPRINRRTTPTFELALSVLFLSGIQHFVEIPSGMNNASPSVKDFLRQLPVTWDETKFISGYPGKDIAVARRSGNKWYVAGINGENVSKKFTIDVARFAGEKSVKLFPDAKEINKLQAYDVKNNEPIQLEVGAYGGFVIMVEGK